MTVYYTDASALLATYLPDEDGSGPLRRLLWEGSDLVVACRIVTVEVPRALVTGVRRGHIPRDLLGPLLDRYERDVARRVGLLGVPSGALERARELVLRHQLRTLDALHLAVAEGDGRRAAGGGRDPLVFVTRVDAQAAVAADLGLGTLP